MPDGMASRVVDLSGIHALSSVAPLPTSAIASMVGVDNLTVDAKPHVVLSNRISLVNLSSIEAVEYSQL